MLASSPLAGGGNIASTKKESYSKYDYGLRSV